MPSLWAGWGLQRQGLWYRAEVFLKKLSSKVNVLSTFVFVKIAIIYSRIFLCLLLFVQKKEKNAECKINMVGCKWMFTYLFNLFEELPFDLWSTHNILETLPEKHADLRGYLAGFTLPNWSFLYISITNQAISFLFWGWGWDERGKTDFANCVCVIPCSALDLWYLMLLSLPDAPVHSD